MVDLGTLGGTFSEAVAVSASGQVVGGSSLPGDASQHAFSWTEKGGMRDLGTLGGSFSEATAVSASGQVVGYGALPGDVASHAVLWEQARL
jgi:probable HAF family extracellular repeat protein